MDVIRKLEFDKVIESIKEYAIFENTLYNFDNIKFENELDKINENLSEAEELRNLIVKYNDIPFNDITDIYDVLKKASKDITITISDALRVIKFINNVKNINNYFSNYEVKYLNKYLNFKELDTLLNQLEKVISPYELIFDNATNKLLEIRQAINGLNVSMRQVMQNLINTYQKYLMEGIIVSKNDTLCLSVKREYKNIIKGVIVDESNTGSTFYIEPIEILSIKSRILKYIQEEKLEIEKILIDLTRKINKYNLDLEYNLINVRRLDYLSCIAKYAIKIDGYKVKINKDLRVNLINARHPLIDKNKIVPLNLEVKNKCIIVTGPNTGGKTVLLKTVGLLSLMTKAGILIPCMEDSEINIFDEIFIDLGDEQSIAQNLSTFSSHMKNIIDLTNNLKDNSLVLLDELGGGTDPDEGCSLAIAILNYIRKFNTILITSTHYQRLKLYAYETNALNAKMEFDEYTLKPTYNLLVGTPGKSCGILVSKHLGLKKEIIDEAINKLNYENDFKILNDLTDELEKSINNNLTESKKYNELKLEYDKKIKELNDYKSNIIKEAKEEANKIIRETKTKANELIKEIDEAKKTLETPKIAKLKNETNKLKEINEFVRSEEEIVINSKVFIIPYNTEGIVKNILKNKYIVSFGNLEMSFKKEELSFIEKLMPKKPEKLKSTVSKNIKKTAKLELDLRGMRYEEALVEIDRFIDDALLMSYKTLSIIHGFGTGVIRKLVWDYLKKCPYVKEYRYGGEGEGLQGATIVELK